jgi:hypothetical protein
LYLVPTASVSSIEQMNWKHWIKYVEQWTYDWARVWQSTNAR